MQRDHTAPTTTPVLSGTVGQNGWYTSPVALSLSVTYPDSCPPPDVPNPSGTVNVPQPTAPPAPGQSDVPPWRQGRPPAGDPGEIPWFTGVIGTVRSKGPTFGPRKDEFLPYLFIRAASGDRGRRAFNGVFWESPDIFVVPNQSADAAPLLPPTTAGVAQAGAPNTLYAHVWNLGKAPAYRVRVEFYWFNPSLGLARANANLVGATWVDLANRFTLYPAWQQVTGPDGHAYMSRGCHAVVRCPVTWVPVFQNGGHECLVVRVYEPMLDAVAFTEFSAAADRHIGQRNIAVVQAASPATIDLNLDLGYYPVPADADLEVELVAGGDMEWLKLYKGDRNITFQPPSTQVLAGLTTLTGASAQRSPASTLSSSEHVTRGCDPLAVGFHASVADLGANQVQVVRVRQRIGGEVMGGYSIVLIGK